MHAENIRTVSIPRQMNSMSQYPVFTQAESANMPARVAGGLEASRRITATAVKFFVPASAADLTGHTSPTVVADAISKVAVGLPGRC